MAEDPIWDIVYLPPGQLELAKEIVRAAEQFIELGGGLTASDGVRGSPLDNALHRLKAAVEALSAYNIKTIKEAR